MSRTRWGLVVGCAVAWSGGWLLAHEGGGTRPGGGPRGGREGSRHGGERPVPCYLATFDADGDGVLNDEERAAAQARIDEIKAKYDADADGHLSCEERQAAVTELCPDVEAPACLTERPHRDHGLPCFLEAFDADGDGALSEEERAAAKAKLEEVRAAADADGDGVVTRAEMHAVLESLCADEAAEEVVPETLALLEGAVESVFIRGDADASGAVELTDAVGVLRFLFQGDVTPACHDAADANDDASVDISDASAILSFLFLGTATLPAPYPGADYDPTEDGVTCISGQAD